MERTCSVLDGRDRSRGPVNSLQTSTIPQTTAEKHAIGNVCKECNLPEMSGWALGSERVVGNKNDVKFTLWTTVQTVQRVSKKESYSREFGKVWWGGVWGGGTNTLGSREPGQKLCLEPCPALPWTSNCNYGNPSRSYCPEWEEQKCHLLKWTGTFQKVKHFQNVKRAARVHSYHLML